MFGTQRGRPLLARASPYHDKGTNSGRGPSGRFDEQKDAKGSPWEDLLRYGGLGTELFGSVIVGAFLGWYIDNLLKLKTPWFLLAGVILGAIARFRDVYRVVKQEEAKEKQQQGKL